MAIWVTDISRSANDHRISTRLGLAKTLQIVAWLSAKDLSSIFMPKESLSNVFYQIIDQAIHSVSEDHRDN
jgi:hypothetical protein